MLQLVQHGEVALHEPLGTYLPGFPTDIAGVTVHQLLTHTSGLGSYSTLPGYVEGLTEWASEAEVMEGLTALIRQSSLAFNPGERHSYSNSGYAVLGALVAEVSGQSYFDYVREHVFRAAGMTGADFYTRQDVREADHIARPYVTDPETGERVDFTGSDYFEYVGGPDHGAYATAADLLRFACALRDGDLLGHAYADLAISGKAVVPPPAAPPAWAEQQFYGYGFRVAIAGGQTVFGHSGSGPGARANVDMFPARGLGGCDSRQLPGPAD